MSGDQYSIASLAKAGIRFLVNARVPGGGRDLLLTLDEIGPYLGDSEAVIAGQFGVTKENYIA